MRPTIAGCAPLVNRMALQSIFKISGAPTNFQGKRSEGSIRKSEFPYFSENASNVIALTFAVAIICHDSSCTGW